MKIPAARAAVDKEWSKLKHLPSWHESEVRAQADVIHEAQNKKKDSRNINGLCHLMHSELAEHLQKYTGRVVL